MVAAAAEAAVVVLLAAAEVALATVLHLCMDVVVVVATEHRPTCLAAEGT